MCQLCDRGIMKELVCKIERDSATFFTAVDVCNLPVAC